MILEGGRKENTAVKEMYDAYSALVINHVKDNNGSREDGEDILIQAIMTVVSHIHDERFRGDSSLKNYLMAIAKNMWLNELRKRKPFLNLTEDVDDVKLKDENLEEEPKELELLRNEKLRTILKLLAKLHKGCLPIFKMFYWYGWALKKIAELLNYVSEDSVKMKKKRCMDELKRFLDDHPDLKDFLRGA